MQRGHANDLVIHHCENREVPAHVNILAPFADDLDVLNAMLNEHPFPLGYVFEKLVKLLFVVGPERPQDGLFAVPQFDVFRKVLQFKFDTE